GDVTFHEAHRAVGHALGAFAGALARTAQHADETMRSVEQAFEGLPRLLDALLRDHAQILGNFKPFREAVSVNRLACIDRLAGRPVSRSQILDRTVGEQPTTRFATIIADAFPHGERLRAEYGIHKCERNCRHWPTPPPRRAARRCRRRPRY